MQYLDSSHFIKRLWYCLSGYRRRQFVVLLGLMFVAALAEVVSLGAVMPFIAVLTAPDQIFSYKVVERVASTFGINTPQGLILPLTIFFAVTALIAGGIRMLLLWASARLSFSTGAELSIEAYRRTLYQRYEVHVSRNSSEVVSGIISKMGSAPAVINMMLILISASVLVLSIIIVLIMINPFVAVLTAFCFGSCYLVISNLTRNRLKQNSKRIEQGSTNALKSLQEGLGGIRDVLLDGSQPIYCEIYAKAERPLRLAQGNNLFIAGSPRFALEAFGMVVIALMAYFLSRTSEGVVSILPVLGALALGAQRLLPALQQIYASWAGISGHKDSLIAVLDLLDQELPDTDYFDEAEVLDFEDDITFNGVRYRYTDESPWVLNGLDLRIPKGSRVGIVGSTGSGKSTTMDLLMGLLEPTEGNVLVDGQPVNGELQRSWQRSIAHVPQHVYLADATLAENIAFGVPKELINMDRVRVVAEQAQIAGYIEDWPGGYDAMVGERGVRLSGGQRQRIGIARSLYKHARVLVLDEATSALDNETERGVIDAIDSLTGNLTIIMIAHRLTTVQGCDTIIQLEDGRLVAQGSYNQLLESSPSFRKMVKAVA
ncbi:MAG: ABC transporter ATP-binding protein [Elusimicrobia bacterium]|nr:MAG: ABC transporter ATP-binding protein [Elusimicrobiota bacterium]